MYPRGVKIGSMFQKYRVTLTGWFRPLNNCLLAFGLRHSKCPNSLFILYPLPLTHSLRSWTKISIEVQSSILLSVGPMSSYLLFLSLTLQNTSNTELVKKINLRFGWGFSFPLSPYHPLTNLTDKK
jgi:hypothetical protein